MRNLQGDHPLRNKAKLFRYLFGKGFDAELIRSVINETLKTSNDDGF
jgi:SOS response regulatory protein OraA/RecX